VAWFLIGRLVVAMVVSISIYILIFYDFMILPR
jgi:hypothetical protein